MNKLNQLKYLWLALAAFVAVSTVQTSFAGMSIKAYGNFSGLGETIGGTTVEDLYAADAFPDAPDLTDYASSIPGLSSLIVDSTSGRFEWPQPTAAGNSGVDNHGMIFQGVFITPADGTYQFFIRSDDGSALYLTDEPLDLDDLVDEDDRPAPDALEAGCCGGFGKAGTVTEVMEMTAGQAKFITLALKEGGGGDWQQVGISVNGGPVEVLSLGHVQRYEYDDFTPAQEDIFIVGYGPDGVRDEFSIEVNETDTANVYVEFDVEIEDQDDVPDITWKVDGDVIEGAKGSQLTFVPLADADEFIVTRTVTAEVDGYDPISFEILVNRDDIAPSLVGAAGSGYPKGILVTFSELVDPASATDPDNYEVSGQDIEIDSVEMVGDNAVILKTSSDFNTDEILVSVSGVTDGALAKNEMDPALAIVSITTNLLAYWPFNDADNTEIAVDVASGISGEILNASYTPDGEGASGDDGDFGMDFGTDNGGQYVFVEDASFLNASAASNQMSVSFWQKNYATGNSSSYWMFSPGVNGSGRGNQAHVPWGNGQIYHDTEGCCGGGTERINAPIANFEDFYDDFFLDWHHYTFIKNGDQKEIWIDGKLFHSGTNSEDFTPRFESMTIGSATNGGNSSQTVMDDFAVFAVGLTEEEVGTLADGGSPLDLAVPLSEPLELVTDLTSGEAEELKPFTIGIEVSGGPEFTIGYQWYLNGEPMLGETTSSISWAKIPKSETGNMYRVEAFNTDGTFNLIQSTEITINVNDDEDAPEIVSVSGSPFNNGATIELNEEIDPESFSADSFEVSAGGSDLDVESATLVGESTVILVTEQQEEGAEYTVTISSISDVAATPNAATDISGSFISWAKQPFGVPALLYTAASGSSLDFFPVETRGTGEFPSGFAPFNFDQPNWENINQGFSSIIGYLETPNSGDINTARVNARDNYGQIVTGWLKPSVTGRYLIALAVDDNAELYLSTDDSPDNAVLVASEPQWNGNRQYDDGKTDNWTEILDLEAGEEYYFEAYMSEGGGGDNLAIAWSYTTDDTDPVVPANGSNPIPGENIIGFQPVFAEAVPVSQIPGDGGTFVVPDTVPTLQLKDGAVEKVDADSFSVVVLSNGSEIPAEIAASKDDDGITTATITGSFGTGSDIEIQVTYSIVGGEPVTISWTYRTSGPTPPPAGAYVSSIGLVNYWDFEGNANDIAGDFPGNASTVVDNGDIGDGVSFADEGPAGQYGLFGGDNATGYVSVANSDDILYQDKSLSISMWFRVDEFNKSWQALIAHGEGQDYRIAREGGNNNLAFNAGDSEPRGGGDINDGEWHHITIVHDAVTSNNILYMDGQQADARSFGTGIQNTAPEALFIGGNPGSGDSRSWNGGIDEVSMWNRALTPLEVSILATPGNTLAGVIEDDEILVPQPYAEAILEDEPIVYFSFDETEGQVADNLGTLGEDNDGLWMAGLGPDDSVEADVSSGDGPRPGEGFIGFPAGNNAALFTGDVDSLWVDVQSPLLSNLQAFTLEYWVKPQNRLENGWSRVGVVGQNDAVEYGFINTNTIQIWTPGGGSLNTNYSFDDGEWHHVATVADGTSIKNYFDGQFINEGGGATSSYGSSDFNVHIGGGGVYDATGNNFDGLIDEVAIFDKAISAERVKEHFDAGSVGLFPGLGGPDPVDDVITGVSSDGSNISFSYTGTLQSAPSAAGPWTDVAGATSPFSEAMSDTEKFYRVISE